MPRIGHLSEIPFQHRAIEHKKDSRAPHGSADKTNGRMSSVEEMMRPQMGLNFERVWAALMENRQQIKETGRLIRELREDNKETGRQIKETGRLLKEQAEEAGRLLKEQAEEADRQMKSLRVEMGRLGNRLGELVEHLVSPNLLKKFNALGYAFGKSSPRVKYEDINTGKVIAEVDALLENGGCALAMEIKTDPSIEDVKDHEKRMETLRRRADSHNDKRDYIGAIAGGIVRDKVKGYALKKGFFVLEQSGDTVNISATPDSWKP
ncbi:MAG: hypothetical protein LBD58_11190, partial [Treponema sp.]|nr:hypothetical protein [Treponema sp.]